jgi:hypothetical protein
MWKKDVTAIEILENFRVCSFYTSYLLEIVERISNTGFGSQNELRPQEFYNRGGILHKNNRRSPSRFLEDSARKKPLRSIGAMREGGRRPGRTARGGRRRDQRYIPLTRRTTAAGAANGGILSRQVMREKLLERGIPHASEQREHHRESNADILYVESVWPLWRHL